MHRSRRGELRRRRRPDAVPRRHLDHLRRHPFRTPAPAAARWNYLDAIYSAANYLRASGAPGDYYHAICVYNHAGWYVAEVEQWAAKYRAAAATAIPVGTLVPGSIARIDPSSGDAIPAPASRRAVQQMILAGDRHPHLVRTVRTALAAGDVAADAPRSLMPSVPRRLALLAATGTCAEQMTPASIKIGDTGPGSG